MSLDFRRDNRTVERFEKDLIKAHKLEDEIATRFAKQIESSGVKCTVETTAIDASGKLLNKLDHHKVDRIFKWENISWAIEIKTAPHDRFFTFKVCSLESCLDQNATILLFLKNSKDFYLLFPDSIVQLLKLPHKIYEAFSPNDPSVRIQNKEFDKYLTKRKWLC